MFKIYNLEKEYKQKLIDRFNDARVIDELVIIKVKYHDFNNKICIGDIVCNKKIASDLIEIFKQLYKNKYCIERINLIDEYNFDDDFSMEDNNTSCFNYRLIKNTNNLSIHSYGLAIDINPFYNPYVTSHGIYPKNAINYVNREIDNPYMIKKDDLCYNLFISYGFKWGGDWDDRKDYQHFYKE